MEEFVLLIKYLFLGIVQGFTEPIPVSSSGHLVMIQHFLGIEVSGMSFELLVNSASLIAVLLIYREDILRLASNGYLYVTKRQESAKSDFRFIVYLIIATIPAGIVGVLFDDVIAEHLKGIKTIGITLLITGIALWSIRNMRGRKNDNDLSIKEIAQVTGSLEGTVKTRLFAARRRLKRALEADEQKGEVVYERI